MGGRPRIQPPLLAVDVPTVRGGGGGVGGETAVLYPQSNWAVESRGSTVFSIYLKLEFSAAPVIAR